MEELICNLPFGPVIGIKLGHGSSVGRSILKLQQTNVDDMLEEIIQHLHGLTKFELILLSLYKDSDGTIRTRINNRVLNRVDAEHMLCKLYIVYERLKGGSRSTSVSPKLCFDHCHPTPGYDFLSLHPFCKDVIGAFRLMVDTGRWVFFDEFEEDRRPHTASRKPAIINCCANQVVQDFREFVGDLECDSNCSLTSEGQVSLVPVPEMENVLLIGAVYGSKATTLEGVIEKIREKTMSPRYGRDLARILMTERECNVRVYTMDNGYTESNNSHPRPDRHLEMDAGNLDSLVNVDNSVVFSQIMLDFVWFIAGYWKDHLGKSFVSQVIPFLGTWLGRGGKIYLPICSYFFVQVVQNWATLVNLYHISFVTEEGCGGIHLCVGTTLLDESQFHQHLGKSANQIGRLNISDKLFKEECATEHVSYQHALSRFAEIQQPNQCTEQVRLICFLKKDDPGSTL
jgi:hypothetical protein